MNEIVTKDLRRALDNPRTRYLIAAAWRLRKGREAHKARFSRSDAAEQLGDDRRDRLTNS